MRKGGWGGREQNGEQEQEKRQREREGRREEMRGRGEKSYAGERDLRELSGAELFYIMMVTMHRGN